MWHILTVPQTDSLSVTETSKLFVHSDRGMGLLCGENCMILASTVFEIPVA